MATIYYAAPLFTEAERAWNAGNAERLRRRFPQAQLLMPQEFCAPFDHHPERPDFAGIYRACLEQLQRAEIVLCVLDGADADSGTCFEAGFAVARGIPVIALRTDWRPAEDGGGNCMLVRSCRALCRTISEAEQALAALMTGAPVPPAAGAPPRSRAGG
jgi:nucleoside 2-deoxyribosyltransferase